MLSFELLCRKAITDFRGCLLTSDSIAGHNGGQDRKTNEDDRKRNIL